jgi:hypothetical protein
MDNLSNRENDNSEDEEDHHPLFFDGKDKKIENDKKTENDKKIENDKKTEDNNEKTNDNEKTIHYSKNKRKNNQDKKYHEENIKVPRVYKENGYSISVENMNKFLQYSWFIEFIKFFLGQEKKPILSIVERLNYVKSGSEGFTDINLNQGLNKKIFEKSNLAQSPRERLSPTSKSRIRSNLVEISKNPDTIIDNYNNGLNNISRNRKNYIQFEQDDDDEGKNHRKIYAVDSITYILCSKLYILNSSIQYALKEAYTTVKNQVPHLFFQIEELMNPEYCSQDVISLFSSVVGIIFNTKSKKPSIGQESEYEKKNKALSVLLTLKKCQRIRKYNGILVLS